MSDMDQKEPLPEEYAADKRLHPALLAHRWQPGQSGNPTGIQSKTYHGRARALKELDRLLEDEKHLGAIRKALSRYILTSPLRAFKTLIMPLLPKEARLELGEGGPTVVWQSFFDTLPIRDNANSTPIDIAASEPSVAADGGARRALPPPSSSTGPDGTTPETTDGSPPRTSSLSAELTPARPSPAT